MIFGEVPGDEHIVSGADVVSLESVAAVSVDYGGVASLEPDRIDPLAESCRESPPADAEGPVLDGEIAQVVVEPPDPAAIPVAISDGRIEQKGIKRFDNASPELVGKPKAARALGDSMVRTAVENPPTEGDKRTVAAPVLSSGQTPQRPASGEGLAVENTLDKAPDASGAGSGGDEQPPRTGGDSISESSEGGDRGKGDTPNEYQEARTGAQEPNKQDAEHQFDMSRTEAQRLGLTESELMRYHHSGVLPDRTARQSKLSAGVQMAQPYRLAPYYGFGPATEERPPDVVRDTEIVEDVPTFADEASFAEWAVDELAGITEEIQQTISGESRTDLPELVNRAKRWQSIYEPYIFNHTRLLLNNPNIAPASRRSSQLMRPLISAAGIDDDTKAGLIGALWYKNSFEEGDAVKELQESIEEAGPAVCAKLIEQTTPVGRFTVRAFNNLLRLSGPAEAKQAISRAVIMPLAGRIGSGNHRSLNSVDIEFRLLGKAAYEIDASEESAQEAVAAGVDFAEAAKAASSICIAKARDLRNGTTFLHHSTTRDMLYGLHTLYLSRYFPRPPVPAELGAFLEAVNERKIAGFRGDPEISEIRFYVNNLARAAGLSLRA